MASPPAPAKGCASRTTHALTEEEISFCWKSLADQGQLNVARLQEFMLDITGESISALQARDMLAYMDANGDGRVGMEDFRNFMSIGRLTDTDAKSFMWTPKAKYREEHGFVDRLDEHHPGEASRPGEQHATAAFLDLGSRYTRRCSLESLAESAFEEAQSRRGLLGGGAAGHEAVGEAAETPRPGLPRSATHGTPGGPSLRALPHTLSELHVQSPSPTPLGYHPPATPHGGQAGPRHRPSRLTAHKGTAPLAHHRQSVLEADPPPTMPARAEPEVRDTREVRMRPPKAAPDEKVLKKIEGALEKYEQASWTTLLREEAEAKRRVFTQFANDPEAWELSAGEFHKMLMKWQRLARWSVPGDLRPGDSLATLEYFLRRDRESRGGREGGSEAQQAEAQQAAAAAEAKLTYSTWLDILGGKLRPEEHSS